MKATLLKDLMKHIMEIDPTKRFSINQIRNHPWYSKLSPNQLEGILVGKDEIPILDQIIKEME